ncbi:MAG: hypothetical protein VKO00_04210 [Cyanobacteriota bacterium]|nr:hypothetical protein [Cyanobacteriota bacterium]
MAGALVLLLSSLSIHGAALQQAARVQAEWRARQRSDQLDATAQHVVAAWALHLQAGGSAAAAAPLGQAAQPLQLRSWTAAEDPDDGTISARFALAADSEAPARRYGVQVAGAAGRVLAFSGLEP